MNQAWTTMPSPVGTLLLRSDGASLTGVHFSPFEPPEGPASDGHPVLDEARRQLTEYFTGERTEFVLPLAPQGSAFQQRVWTALRAIPYGRTVSYAEIARRLALPPGAARAVGLANGSNPIAIVVPCHRVIGSDGTLTGYGGGLERKQALLALESPGLF